MKSICVFCSSSRHVHPCYVQTAEHLGRLMGQQARTLVYGGTTTGCMAILADSVRAHGGKVVGVIPQSMHDRGIAYPHADQLIVTPDMRQRKAIMDQHADAFIALPGGFGTLEELFEIITLKHLQYHTKPVVIINTQGFYDPMLEMIERLHEQRFAHEHYRDYFQVVATPDAAMACLADYQAPVAVVDKWQ